MTSPTSTSSPAETQLRTTEPDASTGVTPVPTTPGSSTASSSKSTASPTPAPEGSETVSSTSTETSDGKPAEMKKDGEPGKDKQPRRTYCIHQKEREEKEAKKAEKEAKQKAETEAREKEQKEKEVQEKKEKKAKEKKSRKSRKRKLKKRRDDSSSDSSDSSSDCDSDAAQASDGSFSSSSSSSDSSDDDFGNEALGAAIALLLSSRLKKNKRRAKKKAKAKKKRRAERRAARKAEAESASTTETDTPNEGSEKDRASVLEYKRVDELYDKEIHDWAIRDSVPQPKTDKYSSYIFTIRRVFDYEGRYQDTVVDIKSPLLKDALHDLMGDIKGISLVEDVPELDPNMLFNYYDELKAWTQRGPKDLVKEETEQKKKRRDPLTGLTVPPLTEDERKQQIDQVKLLLEYIDQDFKTIRSTLFPLLENNMITFDLLWAILKPGTVMYTTCAGSNEPRAFQLEYAQLNSSFMRGKWWSVEGRYLEFEGREDKKTGGGGFGWGTCLIDLDAYKGARKIQSLACYPLKYRKDKDEMRTKLIERGKKFVSLRGQQYKAHNGLAFRKTQRQYVKVHVNGRIMIDSGTFRRINPNYIVSSVKSRNNDQEKDNENNYFYINSDNRSEEEKSGDEEECAECCCCGGDKAEEDEAERERKAMRFIKDDKGEWQLISKAEEKEKTMTVSALEKVISDDDDPDKEPDFTDEDCLLASPVVLGWAFNEKLWLEFPVATVEDISWNDKAFDSLVLPEDQKDIVRALVESHSAKNESNTIDDIITGKGRGLVAVLHGPPGVGKTLTSESIADLLRRPLYCVSSGELGTNPTQLEHELQKILDIAHSWRAVLLIDEADVFLEKRSFADMHRNALVSIFLRLMERFSGILFLTTNRVETFDDAFQSRIHVALRYGELGYKAKVKIWNMFFEMVRKQEGIEKAGFRFTASDVEWLAKKPLNGRQIKNIVRTAQALAQSKGELIEMKHIRTVLNVAEGFENDLKGTGRLDGMNAYA